MESGEARAAIGGLTSLFTLHRAELLRFLVARCGDRNNAEDLLQELWIKASQPVERPVVNGRAYLFRMANNLVLDRSRARQRAMARDLSWLEVDGFGTSLPEERPDPACLADEAIARNQEVALLRSAIDSLPPGAKRALLLHRFDGHGQLEVAQIMGISRSGVEKHLAVAMTHLRKALADCGWFDSAASHRQEGAQGGAPRSGNLP